MLMGQLAVYGNRSEAVYGNCSEAVHGNCSEAVHGNHSEAVHGKCLGAVVLEFVIHADAEHTIGA
jgi:hypothetical protein